MNYLAHIYLSGTKPEIQVGGLLGDFVKGTLQGKLPPLVEIGIRLHRNIDTATDKHPLFRQLLRSMPSPWRRYGGILLDMYCDHLLASEWHNFHEEPLSRYCQRFYTQLQQHWQYLPPAAQHFCEVAPRVNWLECYQEARHLPTMLNNVGKRFRRPIALGDSWPLLQALRPQIHQCFTLLMAEHGTLANNMLAAEGLECAQTAAPPSHS